jgi:hypothetical protein
MELSHLYDQVKQRIDTVNFDMLWQGFRPTSFALYSEDQCFLNGKYIEKTHQFIANTSIAFEGEYIAIWNVTSLPKNLDQFTSLIIHEMFHTHQNMNQETRYADEKKALIQYKYDLENLSLKLQEAQILQSLIEDNDMSLWNSLISNRAYRNKKFPYEYEYEACIEQIEGSAHYVELKALEQLNYELAQIGWKHLIDKVLDHTQYFPIRIISYSIGALMLRCINKISLLNPHTFSNQPFSIQIIEGISSDIENVSIEPLIQQTLSEYQKETKNIINNALTKNEVVLSGIYPLVSLNIYNARYFESFATSTHFVAYNDGEEIKVLYGNFVVQLDEESNIIKVYNQ